MTNVVRGAGRARAARNKRHNEQEKRVVGGDRTKSLRDAAGRTEDGLAKAPAKKAAAKRPAKPAAEPAAADNTGWDAGKTLGANVDALKNAGMTWRAIAEAANANGIEMPWPDGGKLTRARKQFLAGTEGKPKAERAPRRASAARKGPDDAEDTRSYGEKAAERLEHSMSMRKVPWDDENSEDEILEMINGRRITWVSSITGNESGVRVAKDSKHNVIKHGKDGPYVSFVSTDGPFMNISLSRIIKVS